MDIEQQCWETTGSSLLKPIITIDVNDALYFSLL